MLSIKRKARAHAWRFVMCLLAIILLGIGVAFYKGVSASPPTQLLATTTSAPQSPAHKGQTLQPLGSILNPDGTLNTPSGFRGNLNPTGWEIVSGKGEPPRFARSSVGATYASPQLRTPLSDGAR